MDLKIAGEDRWAHSHDRRDVFVRMNYTGLSEVVRIDGAKERREQRKCRLIDRW